jgi:glucose/arabinose dehydrogenase
MELCIPRRLRHQAATLAATALLVASPATPARSQQQQPQIGIAPVAIGPGPYTFDTAEQHKIRVVVVASGLAHPFSLAFLPNGDALITERGARLRLVRSATGTTPRLEAAAVSGTPQQPAFRTGGLHEIVVHPQFAGNGLVYFTYNKAGEPVAGGQPNQRQSAITLVRARLDGLALTNIQELFVGDWQNGASGSRLAFGPRNDIYITTGAPFGEQAQNPNTVYGKVLRLTESGGVPPDNPFVGTTGTRPEIYSMGHRDQLGLTIFRGQVLSAEHGPNGGDEVNLIQPGRNYGWPRISFGRNYEGPRISESPVAPGIEQPLVLWIPSIAPTGMTFYEGEKLAIPAWRNNLFVGSARRGEIPRTGGLERIVFNDKLEELRRESLLTELHQRIRDVRQGPDGKLYVITDEDNGVLLRIEAD